MGPQYYNPMPISNVLYGVLFSIDFDTNNLYYVPKNVCTFFHSDYQTFGNLTQQSNQNALNTVSQVSLSLIIRVIRSTEF